MIFETLEKTLEDQRQDRHNRHDRLFHALCQHMDLRFGYLGWRGNGSEWDPSTSYGVRPLPAEADHIERWLFILADGLDHRLADAQCYLAAAAKRARLRCWLVAGAAAVAGGLISHWCF
jgi:hypothetical protein